MHSLQNEWPQLSRIKSVPALSVKQTSHVWNCFLNSISSLSLLYSMRKLNKTSLSLIAEELTNTALWSNGHSMCRWLWLWWWFNLGLSRSPEGGFEQSAIAWLSVATSLKLPLCRILRGWRATSYCLSQPIIFKVSSRRKLIQEYRTTVPWFFVQIQSSELHNWDNCKITLLLN